MFHISTMGYLPGKVHLELKENAIHFEAPVHKVPQALHELLQSELDKFVHQDVLHKLRSDKWSN